MCYCEFRFHVHCIFADLKYFKTRSADWQMFQLRCFFYQSLSKARRKQQQHKSDFIIVWICYLRSNDKDDWHFPDCHQRNQEQMSTCLLQGALCKSWTLQTWTLQTWTCLKKITMQKQNVLCRSSHSETQINLDSLSICCIIALNLTFCIKCNNICISICKNVHPPYLAKMSFAQPMTSLRLLVSVSEIRNWT